MAKAKHPNQPVQAPAPIQPIEPDIQKDVAAEKASGIGEGESLPPFSMDEKIGEALGQAHQAEVQSPAESSSPQSDLANHPKFAKFKKQGVNQP